MNDKEAIEILRRIDIKFFLCGMIEQNNYIVDEADKVNNAIETVLNLLENQKAEIEEKDKIIDLLIKELYTKAHISTRCYLQTSTEECMKYKNCYECLKKHFENKERRNNGKGN